jgi:hypothetical protein
MTKKKDDLLKEDALVCRASDEEFSIPDGSSSIEEEFNDLDLNVSSMHAGRKLIDTEREVSEGSWVEKIFDLEA